MTTTAAHLHRALLAALLAVAAVSEARAQGSTETTAVLDDPQWHALNEAVEKWYFQAPPSQAMREACLAALATTIPRKDDSPVGRCLQAALGALQGPAEYVDPRAHASMKDSFRSGFAGIGLELAVKQRGQPLKVVSTIAGAPAQRAGILSEDQIVEVDGLDLLPMTLDETLAALRGNDGSLVRLKLQRAGSGERQALEIRRAEIRVITARGQMLAGNVGYLRITQMQDRTATEVERSLRGLLTQRSLPPAALVLDLRTNPGGTLDALPPVASLFALAGQVVVNVAGRNRTETYRTGVPPSPWDPKADEPTLDWARTVPLVLLVNGRTGGAAEALAQFLREARQAILVGERTGGHVHVQILQPLAGQAAAKFATAQMASARGLHWPQGLVPDEPRRAGGPSTAAAKTNGFNQR
jgi:carboxyl-terminal processing protease